MVDWCLGRNDNVGCRGGVCYYWLVIFLFDFSQAFGFGM